MRTALRTVILVLALVSAVLALCVSWLLCPGQSEAEEAIAAGPAIEVVAERYWDEEDMAARAAEIRAEEVALRPAAPRTLAESTTALEEMYAAALRLQPSLERRPQHARQVVDALFVASVEHDVNPFLTLAFASRESGLRANAQGALGEQGLLQLHGYARRVCGRGRDLGQPRANADAGLCWYEVGRVECAKRLGQDSVSAWVAVAAYGTGKCLSEETARRLPCTKRKRAELIKAVGEERASMIWPE